MCRAARSFDAEVEWEEVTEEKLLKFHDVHVFLDPAGFRFYLPAFMVWVLRHPADEQSDYNWSFLYSLVLPDQRDAESNALRKSHFRILTPAQSEAVKAFLEYLSSLPQYWDDARDALNRYWGQF